MQKIQLIVLSSLIALSFLGTLLILSYENQTELSYPAKSINSWYTCQYNDVRIPECRDDASQDQKECEKVSSEVYRCQDFNAVDTRIPSCSKFWSYIDNAKDYNTQLPPQFKQCADECREYAKQNKYYYEKIYTVLWDYCGSY